MYFPPVKSIHGQSSQLPARKFQITRASAASALGACGATVYPRLYALRGLCAGLSDRHHFHPVRISPDRFQAWRMHLLWRLRRGLPRRGATRQRTPTLALGGKGANWARMSGATWRRMPCLWRSVRGRGDSLQSAHWRPPGTRDRHQYLHRLRRLRGAVPSDSNPYCLILPTKRFSTSAGASTCGTWHWVQLCRAGSKALVAAMKWLSPSLGAFFLT